MILNENQLDMYSKCTFLNEAFIISDNDIWYNKKAWSKDEVDVCFILGFSGSGKSTLARKMSRGKDNLAYAELDFLVENSKYNDDELKEKSIFIYEFLKGPGKKYRGEPVHLVNNKQMVRECVAYLIRRQKSLNKKLLIEGIQIILDFDPQELEKYAVCIKGTSYIKSIIRAAKRGMNKKERERKKVNNFGDSLILNISAPVFIARLGKFINYYKNKGDVKRWPQIIKTQLY